MEKSLKFVKISSVALMMAGAAAFTAVPMSWDVAYAKGGKGGDHGGGKPDHAGGGKPDHAGGGGRGGGKPAHAGGPRIRHATTETTEEVIKLHPDNYGSIASDNKWRNAAHALQNGKTPNAAPHSAVGRMITYRDAMTGSDGLEDDVAAAEEELDRLDGLTDDEIAAEFPDGGYEDAVADAEQALADADVALAEAPTAEEALDLIDGADLSEEALAELHRLLGIESDTEADTTETTDTADTGI